MDILITLFCIANTLLLVFLLIRSSAKPDSGQLRHIENLEKNLERLERIIRDEIAKNREEASGVHQKGREELAQNLKSFEESVRSGMTAIGNLNKNQLDSFTTQLTNLTQLNEQKLNALRSVIEERLKLLQDDNSKKLEQMRETVDEKLHSTLEKRLGESFKQVSERLEKVHQGLGEMQTLASGVGDLKKILTNVKTRGTYGEDQLGNLLEEILTPQQYERNVITKKGSRDPVDFAIRFPGKEGGVVYLPVDAKFPSEDYLRLLEAQDKCDAAMIEEAGKALEQRIKLEAKNINEKYIDPPNTTDFAILFLCTESLYAEVLRRSSLAETLRRTCRVVIAGPTTLSALLNSLQMGFRTLAVEQRASEVWTLLGGIKTEFGKFGDILEKTKDKLKQAGDTIDLASKKSRTIEQKLKKVQELPAQAEPLLFDNPNAESANENALLE